MNASIKSPGPPTHCPGCRKDFDPKWFVCPYCGLRLRPAEDFRMRVLVWLAVLLTYVSMITWIAGRDFEAAIGLAIIIGIPLAYVFGKAVLFRMMGEPLTWNQLAKTSVRAAIGSFLIFVVAPMLIGMAFLLLAFMACSGMVGH